MASGYSNCQRMSVRPEARRRIANALCGMFRQEVAEDVVARDFAEKSSSAGNGEPDPDAPNESDDEEDNLVASERREAEDDEDDDGDDPRGRKFDNGVLVRVKLFDNLVAEDGEEGDGDDADDADDPPDCRIRRVSVGYFGVGSRDGRTDSSICV